MPGVSLAITISGTRANRRGRGVAAFNVYARGRCARCGIGVHVCVSVCVRVSTWGGVAERVCVCVCVCVCACVSFSSKQVISSSLERATFASAFDLTLDGYPEAVAGGNDTLVWFENHGGTFAPEVSHVIPTDMLDVQVVLPIDSRNDGWVDIVFAAKFRVAILHRIPGTSRCFVVFRFGPFAFEAFA